MSDFSQKLKDFKNKTYLRTNQVVNTTVEEVTRSIQFGSELTGAPGQPVDTGRLRASWQAYWHTSKGPVTIATKLDYARPVEDGIGPHGPMTLRSQVGGFHSVKLTIAGAVRILEYAIKKAQGEAVGSTATTREAAGVWLLEPPK